MVDATFGYEFFFGILWNAEEKYFQSSVFMTSLITHSSMRSPICTLAISLLYMYAGLLLSCSQEEDNIVENTSQALTISVNPVSYCELTTSHFIDTILYIPLETDTSHLIGDVYKLIPYQNRFYMLDKASSEAIYCFSQEGRLLFHLNKKGKGPGEYAYLENFSIDKETGHIEVFDRGNRKIIVYDSEGNFIEDRPFPLYMLEFIRLHGAYYLYTSEDNNLNGVYLPYNLLVCTTDGKKILKRAFPYHEHLHDVGFSGRLTHNENITTFAYGWQNEVYHLSDSSIKLQYRIDFGEYAIPPKAYVGAIHSDEDMENFVSMVFESDYAFGLQYLAESSTHFTFTYSHKGIQKHVLYDKVSGNLLNFNGIYLAQNLYQAPLTADGNWFYTAIKAHEILDIRAQAQREGEPALAPALTSLMDTLQPYDNPVLLAIKFKSF